MQLRTCEYFIVSFLFCEFKLNISVWGRYLCLFPAFFLTFYKWENNQQMKRQLNSCGSDIQCWMIQNREKQKILRWRSCRREHLYFFLLKMINRLFFDKRKISLSQFQKKKSLNSDVSLLNVNICGVFPPLWTSWVLGNIYQHFKDQTADRFIRKIIYNNH